MLTFMDVTILISSSVVQHLLHTGKSIPISVFVLKLVLTQFVPCANNSMNYFNTAHSMGKNPRSLAKNNPLQCLLHRLVAACAFSASRLLPAKLGK